LQIQNVIAIIVLLNFSPEPETGIF